MQSGRLSDGEGDRFRIIQSVSQSAILFHSDAVAYGRKDECKLIISVWHQVFRTCNTPPAVLTTQTGLYLVDTEISQISLFHLLRVSLPLVQTLVQAGAAAASETAGIAMNYTPQQFANRLTPEELKKWKETYVESQRNEENPEKGEEVKKKDSPGS